MPGALCPFNDASMHFSTGPVNARVLGIKLCRNAYQEHVGIAALLLWNEFLVGVILESLLKSTSKPLASFILGADGQNFKVTSWSTFLVCLSAESSADNNIGARPVLKNGHQYLDCSL